MLAISSADADEVNKNGYVMEIIQTVDYMDYRE